MKTKVNHDVCIGCGLCTSLCSDIFEMNDEGLAYAVTETVNEALISEVQDAKDSCPVEAIEIEE